MRTNRFHTIANPFAIHRARRGAVLVSIALIAALTTISAASAHPHVAENAKRGEGQVVANGQNHPGFVDQGDGTGMSCEGINEPADSGPAGYGLETAHHGPDKGKPGKADGCFVTDFPTQDNSPGLD